jgi:hypothetical protein
MLGLREQVGVDPQRDARVSVFQAPRRDRRGSRLLPRSSGGAPYTTNQTPRDAERASLRWLGGHGALMTALQGEWSKAGRTLPPSPEERSTARRRADRPPYAARRRKRRPSPLATLPRTGRHGGPDRADGEPSGGARNRAGETDPLRIAVWTSGSCSWRTGTTACGATGAAAPRSCALCQPCTTIEPPPIGCWLPLS